MVSPKENNDNLENDILSDLSQNSSDISENEKLIDNQDLVSMFDLPDEPEKKEEIKNKKSNIFDINIASLKDILFLLDEQNYDFVTFEPNENMVKIELEKIM